MRFRGTNEIISSPRGPERRPLSKRTVTVDRRLYHTAVTAKKKGHSTLLTDRQSLSPALCHSLLKLLV